jgi:hypothetical protein
MSKTSLLAEQSLQRLAEYWLTIDIGDERWRYLLFYKTAELFCDSFAFIFLIFNWLQLLFDDITYYS